MEERTFWAEFRLNILVGNARSIKGKLKEVQSAATDYEVIMCFTETHLDDTTGLLR